MIRDYDKKMEIVLDFYNQSQELLSHVHDDIDFFREKYGYDLLSDSRIGDCSDGFLSDLELKEKAETRKKLLLTELGRVGEYSLKYILLLKQMRDYPNQSYEEFNAKPLYGLADKGIGNTYINQYHMDSELVSRVRGSKDNHPLQPLHDYDYLFEMLGILEPSLTRYIYKELELFVRSSKVMESQLPDWFKVISSCFPQYTYTELANIIDEKSLGYKDEFLRVIKESGDVFVRLRYLSNNLDNKQYSLNDVLSLMEVLDGYTRLIHEFNDDKLDIDVLLSFSKSMILKHKKDIIRDTVPFEHQREVFEEQKHFINELFALERVKNSLALQEVIGLGTNLSFDKVKDLLESDYTDEELFPIMANNLNIETLQYFKDNGISNISDIIKLIIRNNMSINDIKNIDVCELPILVHVNVDTLNSIKEISSLYNYVKSNPSSLETFFRKILPDEEDYSLFRKIISMEEVQKYPSLISMLDYEQFSINRSVNGDINDSDVISNIRNNIELFGDSPIFRKLPIMLDANNNKQIYELLVINGFEEDTILSLNSTIFCMPIEFVLEVNKVMQERGIDLIQDGNLSSSFYGIANEIRDTDPNKKVIPLRCLELKGAVRFEGFNNEK